jgi:hypothetical protein
MYALLWLLACRTHTGKIAASDLDIEKYDDAYPVRCGRRTD